MEALLSFAHLSAPTGMVSFVRLEHGCQEEDLYDVDPLNVAVALRLSNRIRLFARA